MKAFASLINKLDSSNKTKLKLEAVDQFLREATAQDKLWFLALFTGKRPKRNVNTALLKQWAIELTGIPEWLFLEAYSSVGDLAETLALILPPETGYTDYNLSQWMNLIQQLSGKDDAEKKSFVLNAWDNLPLTERFIFNKLLGGSFRIGLSSKSLINALAHYYDMEASAVAHSIMGSWNINEVDFDSLIQGKYISAAISKPYPFCLAYPLSEDFEQSAIPEEWQAEYKWDGIRAQLIKRENEVFIWSRGEELVTDQFPEIRDALLKCSGNFVLDGEVLAVKDGQILNFNELQKRLNRKNLPSKILQEIPVEIFLYDLLELEGEDCRDQPFIERRRKLETWIKLNPGNPFHISEIISFKNWSDLVTIRANSREVNSEGLMLKRYNSIYHAGRKRGDWWKWKIEPLTIDAVLIYAQKGSGRRSAYYTDYTFAVKQEDKLVTIAKAYSGLSNKEIQEVSRFVNKNAIEKFGPVRTVKPELVFELAFEGIAYSNRHKSGVALRFPRIVRWRKDKTVADIDDIIEIKKLIP
ncbi:ATP-dependent DNA ligase [Pedobacter ginsengiterrae]|uniref:DNA ligase (ATP) n=1 Tax=Pedobacter ginsengiterrae TaxID=871696 RepID=A0ABP7Q5R4_9SPHI